MNEANNIFLKVKGLSKSFGSQVVIENIDLTVSAGDIVLLQGSNGTGKTTLINVLTGFVEPDSGKMVFNTNLKVEFNFPLKWYQKIYSKNKFSAEKINRLGVVRTWQEVRMFYEETIIDNIVAAIPNEFGESPFNAIFKKSMIEKNNDANKLKAEVILTQLELLNKKSEKAKHLSLGQSKRVGLARALAAGARIIVLDEPMSGLDEKGRDSFIDMIKEISEIGNVAIIIVEHYLNLELLKPIANKFWTLLNGRIEINKFESQINELTEFVEHKTHKEILELIFGRNVSFRKVDLPLGATLYRISLLPNLNKTETSILEVNELTIKFENHILDWHEAGNSNGINFRLFENETSVIFAPNGWGKTSLINVIAGLKSQSSGSIIYMSEDITNVPSYERARKGIVTISSTENVFPNISVKEFLELSGVVEPLVEVEDFLNKKISYLSGGEKQKAILASSQNASRNKLQIFDEPFINLDEESLQKMKRIFLPELSISKILFLPSNIN